jgi:hypothetical protein
MLGACIGQGHIADSCQELARHKINLAGVQEVRCDKGGTVRAADNTMLFYGKGNEIHQFGAGFVLHHRISPVKRVEFLSDRMSYIVMRGS